VTIKGIDVAWAKPSIAQIKGVGAQFVARYFSHDPNKNLTASQVTAYKAANIGSVVVWETTAGRALAGRAAGITDAKAAEAQRKAVGLPDDMVIHFAVDLDTTWAKVQAYFDGIISVIGLARTGCYGGVKVITGAYGHGIRFLWQTVAWSGGVWSVHATIQQRGGTVLGGSADLDYATVTDYGQYPRPNTPQENPVTPAEIAAVADAVVAKLLAGGGVLEGSDIDRIYAADVIPAARPPYNNGDYFAADGKTPANVTWSAKYTEQTQTEGIREAIARLKDIQAVLGTLGAGGLADQLIAELAKVGITLNVTTH
jgi:hypothetical protein